MQADAFTGVIWAHSVFWVTVAFFIFFILFGKKIWSVLTTMLDARADLVRRELDEAQRLRREAEALLADAQKRRESALADAKRMLESAQIEAARAAETLAADAEAAAKRRERMALDRIAAAEKAALNDVRMAAAEVASEAARRLLSDTLSPEADAPLIDAAITNLPTALRAA